MESAVGTISGQRWFSTTSFGYIPNNMDGDLAQSAQFETAAPLAGQARHGVDPQALKAACAGFADAAPFPHAVIDDFLPSALADALEAEIPSYGSDAWLEYRNAIEVKRTCNDWNRFPPTTYAFFSELNSAPFVAALSALVGVAPLYPDPGLNGAGWHIHGPGGKLTPHLDYSIHPKVGVQRKLNLIIYLNRDLRADREGELGLWAHDPAAGDPCALARTIAPLFNRAVLFDTTRNSWHGLPAALRCPEGTLRKSRADYYLIESPARTPP